MNQHRTFFKAPAKGRPQRGILVSKDIIIASCTKRLRQNKKRNCHWKGTSVRSRQGKASPKSVGRGLERINMQQQQQSHVRCAANPSNHPTSHPTLGCRTTGSRCASVDVLCLFLCLQTQCQRHVDQPADAWEMKAQ